MSKKLNETEQKQWGKERNKYNECEFRNTCEVVNYIDKDFIEDIFNKEKEKNSKNLYSLIESIVFYIYMNKFIDMKLYDNNVFCPTCRKELTEKLASLLWDDDDRYSEKTRNAFEGQGIDFNDFSQIITCILLKIREIICEIFDKNDVWDKIKNYFD